MDKSQLEAAIIVRERKAAILLAQAYGFRNRLKKLDVPSSNGKAAA